MPLTPAAPHSSTTLGTSAYGTAMMASLTGPGHFREPAEGEHAGELEGLRVDRVDRAGEAALDDVLQQLVAHGAPFAAGPDHGHGGRGEQFLDAAGLGAVFPGLHHGAGLVRGVDVEFEADHAVVEVPFDVVPGVGEHHQHLPVFRQHLGAELPDPVFAGGGGEVFEQDGPDAAALVRVGDVERDFGLRGVIEPVVAADAR